MPWFHQRPNLLTMYGSLTPPPFQRRFTPVASAGMQYYDLNTPFVATGDFEINVEFSTSSYAGFPSLLSGESSGDSVWMYLEADKVTVRLGGSVFKSSPLTTIDDTKIHTATIKRISGDVTIGVDGNFGTPTAYAADVIVSQIGNRGGFGYFNGYIANVSLQTAGDNRLYKLDENFGETSVAVDSIGGNNGTAINIAESQLFTESQWGYFNDTDYLYYPFAEIRRLIQQQLSTNGDLNPEVDVNTPAVSLGGAAPSLSGLVVSKDDTRIAYIGGNEVDVFRTTFPGTLFNSPFNLSFDAVNRSAIGSSVEFRTSCPRFEIKSYGQGIGWRLLVNNKIAAVFDDHPPDGSVKYVLVDFTAVEPTPVERDIRIEYYSMSPFGGIVLDTSGSMMESRNISSLKICYLGDSFTEGAGTSETALHSAYAPYSAKKLGFDRYAMSGFGGTGYKQSLFPGFGFTRPNLSDRVQYDAIGYDVYVIAMGINDSSDTAITAEVENTFDTIRANNPDAVVYVFGSFGNGSGGRVTGTDIVDGIIESAAAARNGFVYNNTYQEIFTKSDSTHPDDAGHIKLGEFVSSTIANEINGWAP